MNVAEKLAARSVRNQATGCLEWQGANNGLGYGVIGRERGTRYTHRLSWELTRGPIPEGLCVLHKCDNPRCIEPDHLFLGTMRDNHQDMLAKGRWSRVNRLTGEHNPQSKLKESDVRAILADRRPSHHIASELGISGALVRYIRRGEAWKHVER